MLSLVHGSLYFMPVVIDFGYLCFILLHTFILYIAYGVGVTNVHMPCYLHTSPLLRTIVISHSLHSFSVQLIFKLILMLDLFFVIPMCTIIIYCLWCNTCMPCYVHTSLLLRAIASTY